MTAATKARRARTNGRRESPVAGRPSRAPQKTNGAANAKPHADDSPEALLAYATEKADEADRLGAEAARLRRQRLECVRESGEALRKLKRLVKQHGEKWDPWLEVHFPRHPNTARLYMRVARYWDALQAEMKQQGLVDLGLEGADKLIRQIRRIARRKQRPDKPKDEVRRWLPPEEFKQLWVELAAAIAAEYEAMLAPWEAFAAGIERLGKQNDIKDASTIRERGRARARQIAEQMSLTVLNGRASLSQVETGELRRSLDKSEPPAVEANPPTTEEDRSSTEDEGERRKRAPGPALYTVQLERLHKWAVWRNDRPGTKREQQRDQVIEDTIVHLWQQRRSGGE